jgi:hypothetical protein
MTTMLERSEEMVDKQVRGKYTLEYKLEAVRQVKAGQSGAVKATMGMFHGNRDSRLTDEGAAEHL